ncbi:MAG: hypothetical protein NZM11_04165 [Anaerolineales bacterium]|nr:hypothetical protein [Anaerolineales bacterium]
MDRETFDNLLTSTGQAAIAAAAALQPTEETFLRKLTQLRKHYDAALAKAALETVLLRARARAKFSRAEAMYFTREALEQASSEVVATYRAQRYAGLGRVADVCCGLGGDAIGLAGVAPVMVIDKDPLRLALAQANLAAYGRAAEAVPADVTIEPLPAADALWLDPSRRAGSRRAFSVRDYTPPLSIIREWLARTPALGVKISPGVDLAELDRSRQSAVYGLPDFELEFISVHGELKECVLWFGLLRTQAVRRATLLPGPHSLTSNLEPPSSLGPPLAFLYEPDPAVLRAGLVTTLATQLSAYQLDPDIAYLTSDTLTPTPFARAFALEAAFPFQLKRLRAYLRERGVGQVTVKKRGSPLKPEELTRRLRLSGEESRVVFLTHVRGEPYVLIGQAVA